jgi:DNA helicase II / ATP-dependent DNA helicase PcrA
MLAVASTLVGSEAEVGRAVRGRYTHITIDEFQDTNRLQWDLLLAWAGDRDDVCVVGDADQAIYGFTGASPRYLTAFRARFPVAAVVRLQTNHRSTQAICDTAAAVLRGRPLRATAAPGPPPLLTGHDDEEGERAYVVDRCRQLRASGLAWD